MNILETIVAQKRIEIEERKRLYPLALVEKGPGFNRNTVSLRGSLKKENSSGIIAEFKRKSPSKGVINGQADVQQVTVGYARSGAAALSVLTDVVFFGGSDEDLQQARISAIPILRKDFMIDEYQIIESRSLGADVILLIAACLSTKMVRQLAVLAKSIGLEVLLEIHDKSELGHICPEIDIVGVNNRDLKTFLVDIRRSIELSQSIPEEKVRISESGLNTASDIELLRGAGYSGFLIGEKFMREPDPELAFFDFVNTLTTRPALPLKGGNSL